jgi:hypothetical protein
VLWAPTRGRPQTCAPTRQFKRRGAAPIARGVFARDRLSPRLRLPSAKVLVGAAVLLGLPGAALAQARAQRLEVEHRAGAVAQALTGRHIHVRCPGPIRRRLFYEINDGVVRFHADGTPPDDTRLSPAVCDGLRDVLDRGPAYTFSCLATDTCAAQERRAARAVAVLTHETMHLRGTIDEAVTECQAIRRVAWVAEQLGIRAEAAQRIPPWEDAQREQLPDRYRNGVC